VNVYKAGQTFGVSVGVRLRRLATAYEACTTYGAPSWACFAVHRWQLALRLGQWLDRRHFTARIQYIARP
jgi:hypothetical protein